MFIRKLIVNIVIKQKIQNQYINELFQIPMSHDLQNISIELEDSLFDKPDSELTQQLYEMARRIAQSDRNNQAYRQVKKSKTSELDSLTKNKIQLQNQLRILEEELDCRKKKDNQNNMIKKNRKKFQEYDRECQQLSQKQKQIQVNASNVGRENEKLEKKIAALQIEYEIMVKENKHKGNIISKLNKQKQEKMERIRVNEQKIQQLEDQCQQTKKRAEDLQNQLRQEIQTERQLDQLIKDREELLQKQRMQQEETSRKQEESKRAINKMINSAKALQTQIQMKFKEAEKLEDLHNTMRDRILNMEQQHQQLEDFMSRRKQIIQNLKHMSSKVTREEEALGKLKDSSQLQ